VKAAAGTFQQLGRGGHARAFDRRSDPAASPRDFLVSGARAAHRMLIGAGAAEDEVGVAID
jgi:hypothetical protein